MSPNDFCAADKLASQTPIYVPPAVGYFYPMDKISNAARSSEYLIIKKETAHFDSLSLLVILDY